MKTTSYRLAEYKITESGTGALWWEAHTGIGAVVGGKCSIRGEILFIGPSESEEAGFLAKEFLDQLGRIPQWKKTNYYCLNYEICNCKSGRKLTEEEIATWSKSQTRSPEETGLYGTSQGNRSQAEESGSTQDVAYRLGKYEIIQKPNGQVWWKTPSGRTGLRVGRGVIAGDILFIGAVETEEQGNLPRQFLDRLDQLPEWKSTQYYSVSYALHDCVTGDSLSKGTEGRWPGADSLPKGEGLSRKNAKLQEIFNLVFSKLRKIFRPVHNHTKTRAAMRTDRIDSEKKNREKRANNKSIREANARKFNLPSRETAIQWLGRNKWIGYIAAFLLITGCLLIAVLVDHWKKEEGHHRRDNHRPNHRNDH